MGDYPYASAPLEYFTRFRRTGKGFQGLKQRFVPESAVLGKERYFAWAQSIYLANTLASSGLLKEKHSNIDVAVIGSGIPFLGEQLDRNGIRALSFDPNKNLADLVKKDLKLRHSFVQAEPTNLPLADESVSVAASHNFLQKLPSEENAMKAIAEMMRVAKDYAIIQVTPREHPYFKGDDTHALALSVNDWENLIAFSASYSEGWSLKELHKVRIAHSVSAGRPPVFILEKNAHAIQKRNYMGLTRLTKVTWILQDEATPANAISVARPIAAYLGIRELDGIALSAFMAATMATDALDGIIARKTGPSPFGSHIDRMSDHATECIALFGLGFPLIPYVHVARDAIVDAALLAGAVDEKADTTRRNPASRYGYGLLKGTAFVTKPVSPVVGDLLGYASTVVSLERGFEVVKRAVH